MPKDLIHVGFSIGWRVVLDSNGIFNRPRTKDFAPLWMVTSTVELIRLKPAYLGKIQNQVRGIGNGSLVYRLSSVRCFIKAGMLE